MTVPITGSEGFKLKFEYEMKKSSVFILIYIREPFNPLKDRPEWRDIIPKDPEAGKSYSVVKICYSDEFKDAFDYFRAIVEKVCFHDKSRNNGF